MFRYVDKQGHVYERRSYREKGAKYPKAETKCIGRMDENNVFQPNAYFIERTAKENLEKELQDVKAQLEKANAKRKNVDEDAVGKCGFYCPSCPSFTAGNCAGCMNGNKDGDCYTRDCVLCKGISFCGQCKDFPCDVILTKPRSSVLDRDWLEWKKKEKLSQK